MYQYYQISVDNKKSNKSFRDKSKSENHENKTPNSATVIEPNDKFQDELFEGQDVSWSDLYLTPALNIANELKKEVESRHLLLLDLLTLTGI